MLRDNAKVTTEVESVSGQVKQAQSVVPPMERLVQGLEKQQADTLKYAPSMSAASLQYAFGNVFMAVCAVACMR